MKLGMKSSNKERLLVDVYISTPSCHVMHALVIQHPTCNSSYAASHRITAAAAMTSQNILSLHLTASAHGLHTRA